MGSAEEISTDDESLIAAAQARLTERRREVDRDTTPGLAPIVIPLPRGVAMPKGPQKYFCAGGSHECLREVPTRGEYCPPCAKAQAAQLRAYHLHRAFESVSPKNAMGWCRVGTPAYVAGTQEALRDANANIENPVRRQRALRLIREAAWTPLKREPQFEKIGSLLITGRKRIGKTNVAVAIALSILDCALAGGFDAAGFAFAKGIRLITGMDIARARSKTKLGEEPRLITEATRASLLILDEIGFEDSRHDPQAVRDVIYDRYRRGRKAPTIATSGCTLEELSERYGAAVERLTDLGELVDLHPRSKQ